MTAFRSTVAFNRVGVSIRDTKPPLEALDRAASRLEEMFAAEVLPLEDKIAAVTRQQVPTLLETVGSLPDRLRLLGLPGEDRARGLLEACADLLKDDAGGATSLLGVKQSNIPSDVSWAKAVSDCLNSDAEQTIRTGNKFLADLANMAAMFPKDKDGLASEGDEAVIREAFGSQNFHERMPSVRSSLHHALVNVTKRYGDIREQYATDLEEGKTQLEVMPEWLRISSEDQEEIASKMIHVDVPEHPRSEQEIADLLVLLARRASILSRLATLQDEVRNRVPPPVVERQEKEEAETQQVIETISFRELVPPHVLRTRDDLDTWLAALRERLLLLVDENKHISIR